MRFIKMHGAGNDYVYVDCFQEPVPEDVPATARAISDRHTGVGGDGLVLITPSEQAPLRMRMFNVDGTEAEMCGNALRCVAKYAAEQEIVTQDEFPVETGNGLLSVRIDSRTGTRVDQVRVNMGRPILEAAEIPTTLPGAPPQDVSLDVGGTSLQVTCVSMGNPHCVTFVDEITDEQVLGIGPQIERHSAFPNRVNVEFIKVRSPSEFDMRVWERGSGETMACGTGACAAAVAGILTGRMDHRTIAHLRGGDLVLEWSESGDVWMTGPATEVFRGEWPSS
jgi:diaminopimelate epimerase